MYHEQINKDWKEKYKNIFPIHCEYDAGNVHFGH